MKKSLYILIAVLVVLIAGAVWAVSKWAAPAAAPTTPYTNPYSFSSQSQPTPVQNARPTKEGGATTIQISNAVGGTFDIKNLNNDPEVHKDTNNQGHYFIGNQVNPADPTASSTPAFTIEYIDATQYFGIALLQEPIGSARLAAEQYLMQHLGLTQTQMCQLKYMVSTPYWVSPTYTGTSLGFSFCPGAVVLPN